MKKLTFILMLMMASLSFSYAKEPVVPTAPPEPSEPEMVDPEEGEDLLQGRPTPAMDPAVKSKLDKGFAAFENLVRTLGSQSQAGKGSRSQISLGLNATPAQGTPISLNLKLSFCMDMAQKKGVAKLDGDLGKLLCQFDPTTAEVVLPDYGMFSKIPMKGDFAKLFSAKEEQVKNMDVAIAKMKADFFSNNDLSKLKSAPEETFGGEPCDVLQSAGEESAKVYISKATGLLRGLSGSGHDGEGSFQLDYQNGLPTKLTGDIKAEGKTASLSAMVEWTEKVVTKASWQLNISDPKGTKVVLQFSLKSDCSAVPPEELVLTYKKAEFREATQEELGQALMMGMMGKMMALAPLLEGLGTTSSSEEIVPPLPDVEKSENSEGY